MSRTRTAGSLPDRNSGAPDRTGTLWSGIMIGVGLAGTLDEVLLHQLLHWHHFYDRSSSAVGLVSDGLFHIFSTALLALGIYRTWRDRAQPYPGWTRRLWGGTLLGAGGFNLFDGTVQHKVLRFHQVRPEAENWLPYDLTFIGIAAALVVVGLVLLRGVGPRPGASR